MSTLLRGAPVAERLTLDLSRRSAALRHRGVIPTLAILRVGSSPGDLAYEKGAAARCARCGIEVRRLFWDSAAPLAEAIRAGILAVPKGQIEAGKAIGLSRFQVFLYVELPQAWAVAVPAIGANVLFLMKETSIVSAVGIAELLFVTKDIIGMDYKTNEALFLLFASYLIILLPVSLLARWAENRVRSAKYGV